MGKPTAADLRLGLATAPVLFAAQEVNEININLDRLMDLLHHARFVPDSDTISRVNDKWRKIMYKMYYLVLENYQAKGLFKHESFSTPWGVYSQGAAITELLGSMHCTLVGQVNFNSCK